MFKQGVNLQAKYKQYKNLFSIILSIAVVLISAVIVFSGGKASEQKTAKNSGSTVFDGVVDEEFTEADSAKALTNQQEQVSLLKAEIDNLKKQVVASKANTGVNQQTDIEANILNKINISVDKKLSDILKKKDGVKLAYNDMAAPVSHRLNKVAVLNSVSFAPITSKGYRGKTTSNYVTSGTFAKAVVLGGVDADASVNGQRTNNGVMLFKIINEGTLPNSQRSHLKGCFITASTYGDISSERAYVALNKISCAKKGYPIIDKAVTGWAFFGGKAGIKGSPLMRDGKIVQYAGISGVIGGLASVAQFAQTAQGVGAFGVGSVLPGSKVLPYAGYGGASKAGDILSNYYIKRAEQYHPVIQIGAGNLVNIVFKDGFSLLPEDSEGKKGYSANQPSHSLATSMIPENVLREAINQKNISLGGQVNA